MKTTRSFWRDDVCPTLSELSGYLDVDVAIVRGGVCGVITAYLLKRAGFSVCVLERDRIASGETGYTTAHLAFVTDQPLQELIKAHGESHAPVVWQSGEAALELIHEIVEREKIECGFRWLSGFYVSSN